MGAAASAAARRLGLALGAGSDLLPHLLPPLGALADPALPAGAPLPLIPDALRLLGCGGGGGGEPPGEPGSGGGGAAQGSPAAARPPGAGPWQAEGSGGGGGEEEDEEEEAGEPKLGHAWQTGDCLTIPMTVMYTFSSDLGQARASAPGRRRAHGQPPGARAARRSRGSSSAAPPPAASPLLQRACARAVPERPTGARPSRRSCARTS